MHLSPKATFEKLGVNGIQIEHEVSTFEFPYNGPKGGKREAEKQRGPKKHGILCSVYSHPGPYMGQLALSPAAKGKVAQYLKDRKEYKPNVGEQIVTIDGQSAATKYSDSEKAGLKCVITQDINNRLDFDLKSK